MPPGNTGSLSDTAYVEIIAYIFASYGAVIGDTPLPTDQIAFDSIPLPGKGLLDRRALGASGRVAAIALPTWPKRASTAESISPITEDLLQDPPKGSWLSWRRTPDAAGFSPLSQINKNNIQHLRAVWSLGLTAGSTQSTPLVHDGVMFAYSFGDKLQALDGATGDELWRYSRKLLPGRAATVHRNIALFEDKVYLSTSDAYLVALEMRTGNVVWEQSLSNSASSLATGGPLVAQGVVMQGVLERRGGYIAGLDARTGRPLWRFNTIAQPGDPNDRSWNGVPPEKRSGGHVWTAGSYDAKNQLAFFGPSPTYDTGPLRDPSTRPGVTNHALYTDTTLAIHPKTGELAWYYQHLPNDQWNLDWAFERHVVRIRAHDEFKDLIVTAGKLAIYDALEARTGRYVFSMDLGLQNVITGIDRRTGAKSIDRRLVPGDGHVKTICPHQGGGKNWLPASYNSMSGILYVPLVESCMDLIPVASRLEGANLTTNVTWVLRARPDSDGRYGRIAAVDIGKQKTVWIMRQRAPQTTGILATAGGIIFAGALDRWFTAYDAETGTEIWKTRVTDIPNGAPMSYVVNGRQYVALVVGVSGYGQAAIFPPLTPEISLPIAPSAAVWVFALPEQMLGNGLQLESE
jgi:alcohol dehydrogenase (cytochrome c)